ncbi:MAG: hypothetical protein WCO51_12075 [bacterium]
MRKLVGFLVALIIAGSAFGAAPGKRIDWSKVKKTVFCSIMLNYGTAKGPTKEYAGWSAAGCRPGVVLDKKTGRRDMPMLYQPMVGPYDQKDPRTIKYHMDMADRMGIDSWAVWYWPPLDKASKVHRNNMKLYMDYIEKHHRRVKVCAVMDNAFFPVGVELKLFKDWTADDVVKHAVYVLKNFASRPSYFKYEGRPVMFMYGTWIFRDHHKPVDWDYVLNKIRKHGYDPIFIVEVGPEMSLEVCPGGEGQFKSCGSYYQKLMTIFEGVFNVCQIGYGGLKDFNRANVWKAGVKAASEKNALYMPNPSAGYHTYLWEKPPATIFDVPRKDGQHYSDTWQDASNSGARWIFLHTWNEWYENTQLEPALDYKYLYVDLTRKWIKKFKSEK